MKITKSVIKQIIKEEYNALLSEAETEKEYFMIVGKTGPFGIFDTKENAEKHIKTLEATPYLASVAPFTVRPLTAEERAKALQVITGMPAIVRGMSKIEPFIDPQTGKITPAEQRPSSGPGSVGSLE